MTSLKTETIWTLSKQAPRAFRWDGAAYRLARPSQATTCERAEDIYASTAASALKKAIKKIGRDGRPRRVLVATGEPGRPQERVLELVDWSERTPEPAPWPSRPQGSKAVRGTNAEAEGPAVEKSVAALLAEVVKLRKVIAGLEADLSTQRQAFFEHRKALVLQIEELGRRVEKMEPRLGGLTRLWRSQNGMATNIETERELGLMSPTEH